MEDQWIVHTEKTVAVIAEKVKEALDKHVLAQTLAFEERIAELEKQNEIVENTRANMANDLNERSATITDLRSRLDSAHSRIASLEAVANNRSFPLKERYEEVIEHLRELLEERFEEMKDTVETAVGEVEESSNNAKVAGDDAWSAVENFGEEVAEAIAQIKGLEAEENGEAD